MTRRGLAAVAALVTSAVCALSLGNALYLYIAILMALVLLYGFISCFGRGGRRFAAKASARLPCRGVKTPICFCRRAIAAPCPLRRPGASFCLKARGATACSRPRLSAPRKGGCP